MHRLVVVLTLATGCDFAFHVTHVDEAPTDASAGDGGLGCYGRNGFNGAGLAKVCLDALPPASWAPAALPVDTSAGLCTKLVPQVGGVDLCVIAAENISVDVAITTMGNKPLVLLATKQLLIDGTGGVSVASRRGSPDGAGSNEITCAVAGDGATDGLNGGGGGGGGSFGRRGGAGGAGSTGAGGGVPADPPVDVTFLRGGCRGGAGGGTGGNKAASGGALYLIAGEMLIVNGTLDASGGGGNGSSVRNGGGGGGSGGLIGLDAPMIQLGASAAIVANGGGGGGGGGGVTPGGGNGGEANLASPPTFPAAGGTGGGTAGGGGGPGDTRAAPALDGSSGGTSSTAGGGGGGGSAGVIKFFSVAPMDDQGARITPAPS